jgi:hypothetical protein
MEMSMQSRSFYDIEANRRPDTPVGLLHSLNSIACGCIKENITYLHFDIPIAEHISQYLTKHLEIP